MEASDMTKDLDFLEDLHARRKRWMTRLRRAVNMVTEIDAKLERHAKREAAAHAAKLEARKAARGFNAAVIDAPVRHKGKFHGEPVRTELTRPDDMS
jgi:sigma54-dependent transcription regulator